MSILKTIGYILAVVIGISIMGMIVGAFAFGIQNERQTNPAVTSETQNFYPHGYYAKSYIPSVTEIGNGRDWYMIKKEISGEGIFCKATYTKDEHRIVIIYIGVFPTIKDAKIVYNKCLEDAPYVECPTMGVCDQSFQYVEETQDEYGLSEEAGTGVIRDGNIIAHFIVYEDNMFIGLNSRDMERYAKNIEKKINSINSGDIITFKPVISEIESPSTITSEPKLNSLEGMKILNKYDTNNDNILNNEEKQPITDLYNRDMLTPKQKEAYIAIWGIPS